MLQEILKKRF